MPTDGPPSPREVKFGSEQLMLQLGRHLVDTGAVTREQLEELQSRRALTAEPLDRLLVKESVVSETEVQQALSELTNIPFRPIADFDINRDIVAKTNVPSRVALRYGVMPLAIDGGVITLATSRVPDVATADSIRMLLNLAVKWVLCTEADISSSIKLFYGVGADTIDRMQIDAPDTQIIRPDGTDVTAESDDAGVTKFVNEIIAHAIDMAATDIHIEPFENKLRLRLRVDGMLQTIPVPKGLARWSKAIASRVKILSDLNIAERRTPQDGRIKVMSGEDEFDLRVSILPTKFGEAVNMRILNRKTMFIDLEHLGLKKSQSPRIEHLSSLPHGVILLTGPTGSGKTTTLYALLARLNKDEVKIITVEDPIEYQIHGINQIQVHEQIHLTFDSILPSILRHDPDIILIGEIRDRETADIAVRSSLTGHLVFSTLHTNDAPSAVTRLADMGIEAYLISSCLEGVIAQRLVRRICTVCRQPITPDEVTLEELRAHCPDRLADAKFYKAHGCPTCFQTGYKGRIALFEIMILDDTLRSMIVHQRPSNEIKKAAIKNGLETLRRDGWSRVLDGITTIEEVMRVARMDAPSAAPPAA